MKAIVLAVSAAIATSAGAVELTKEPGYVTVGPGFCLDENGEEPGFLGHYNVSLPECLAECTKASWCSAMVHIQTIDPAGAPKYDSRECDLYIKPGHEYGNQTGGGWWSDDAECGTHCAPGVVHSINYHPSRGLDLVCMAKVTCSTFVCANGWVVKPSWTPGSPINNNVVKPGLDPNNNLCCEPEATTTSPGNQATTTSPGNLTMSSRSVPKPALAMSWLSLALLTLLQ